MNQAFADFKLQVANANQQMQGSLSAAIATSTGSAASAAAGPKSRTLDEDKRLEGLWQITKNENITVITELYKKAGIELESACPGSSAVLDRASKMEDSVTTELIERERIGNRLTAHRLNRELVSWMTNVFTQRACPLYIPTQRSMLQVLLSYADHWASRDKRIPSEFVEGPA